jgi:hypothetical protein
MSKLNIPDETQKMLFFRRLSGLPNKSRCDYIFADNVLVIRFPVAGCLCCIDYGALEMLRIVPG